MPIWEACTIVSKAPGGRVDLDGSGPDWARVLAPQFVRNDGTPFASVGYGVDLIPTDEE
jgi:hypothetical protein